VYPKSLDTFLLLFYISLIPVAITHQQWLQYWVAPFHHGVVAGFMWVSSCKQTAILFACGDRNKASA
jgi:hypothetical protein